MEDFIIDSLKKNLGCRFTSLPSSLSPGMENPRYALDNIGYGSHVHLSLWENGKNAVMASSGHSWNVQVLCNTVHVIVSGMVFLVLLHGGREATSMPSKPLMKSLCRSDYLDIIKHSMDLSTIKEKVRRLEYKSREEFRHDVWQITYNAHKYNDGRNPGIPPLANQLLELCDYLLSENDNGLTEAEAGIEYWEA
ncbi:Transcription initiation factor TFIID subunit 1 [Camellia lanceoleosa]|uniref:Transcription initiation factor TFIID subunit 1 n=1 Tax=Camellia lanceoleosa TaxID=1840588 RepID=A0ACC0H351_9ERIC|nr:Transcription initiation factor TFIID subunit 1 [Camellia lanceoleosa]